MNHGDFQIGREFASGDGFFRCTDIGSRVVVAIKLGQVKTDGTRGSSLLDQEAATAQGWFCGPPYAVAELVFDEEDMQGCSPANVTA